MGNECLIDGNKIPTVLTEEMVKKLSNRETLNGVGDRIRVWCKYPLPVHGFFTVGGEGFFAEYQRAHRYEAWLLHSVEPEGLEEHPWLKK